MAVGPDLVVTVKSTGVRSTVVSSPGGAAVKLVQLDDVTATPKANGDVLTWISANGKFEFHPGTGSGTGGNANVSVATAPDNTTDGTIIGTRGKITFLEGDNTILTVTDDPGNDQVYVDIAAPAPGSLVQSNGVLQSYEPILNFIPGNNITFVVQDDTGSLRTNITINASGGSGLDQFARDNSNGAFGQANTANVTGQAAFDAANNASDSGTDYAVAAGYAMP
jgi:hypothetical protein